MESNKLKLNKSHIKSFGFFCLVVSLFLLLLSMTVIPSVVFLLFLEWGILGFILSCLLISGPALILSITGVFRRNGKGFSIAALVICLLCTFFVLPFKFITYSPAGSVPKVFREYKFRKACPCDFWLDFDSKHMTDVQSRNSIFLVKFGTVRFQSDPNTYHRQKVIDYAEQNGWICKCSIFLSESNLHDYYSKELPYGSPIKWALGALKSYNYTELIWLEDCDVLLFDAKTQHGMPAYVLISGDGSKMEVRYANPRLPDPGHEFWLPDGFDELPGDCGNQDSGLPNSMSL